MSELSLNLRTMKNEFLTYPMKITALAGMITNKQQIKESVNQSNLKRII